MNAVCDTSPLCFLILIGEVKIVPLLFDEVFVPPAVASELRHPKAPRAVRDWISAQPEWLQIRPVKKRDDPRLRLLHSGEAEAILLAQDLAADWLVVDEMAGRRVARSLDLRVTGLLGLLSKAAERELVDLPSAVQRLRETHFRVAERLLKEVLERSWRTR